MDYGDDGGVSRALQFPWMAVDETASIGFKVLISSTYETNIVRANKSTVLEKISNDRAVNVRQLMIQRGCSDKAIKTASWGINRTSPVPHQVPPGPDPREKYVLVRVSKEDALKALKH